MKARTALLTLAMCLLAGTLWAAENPTIGTWKLDEVKSKIVPGVGKNTTVIYTADGDNMKVTLDGVNSSGEATHSEWIGKLDGKPYPVTGDPNINMRSVKQVNPHTLDVDSMKDGKSVGTAKVVISKNGKTRELTTHSTVNGKKVESHYFYNKE